MGSTRSENSRDTVNLPAQEASTGVVAACTTLSPMSLASSDEHAQEFSLVVANHRLQIFRFLLASTRDVDLAETLTQECFLKAHRNWSGFRGESSAMTWLMRIAINLQKDHWRNRRLQGPRDNQWRHLWRRLRRHRIHPPKSDTAGFRFVSAVHYFGRVRIAGARSRGGPDARYAATRLPGER